MNQKSIDWIGFPGLRALDEREKDNLTKLIDDKVLYRGAGLTPPKYVSACEEALCRLFNKKYCLLLNSATSALIAFFHSIDLQPGDEVVLPAYGWITDLMSVLFFRATPVFCPIESGLTLSVSQLESCITEKTKAIVPIYACGNSCDITAIQKLINRYPSIAILEDACQCLFGYSTETSRLADATVLSFQAFKLITCGEGGALLTDDIEIYTKATRFHDAGLSRFGSQGIQEQNEIPQGIGLNLRMSELSAAVLSCQLEKHQDIIKKLIAAREKLLQAFLPAIGSGLLEQIQSEQTNHSFLLLQATNESIAEAFIDDLNKKGYPFKLAANLPYHALPGWIRYLEANHYEYRNINYQQSLKILEKTIIVEVNFDLTASDYSQLFNSIESIVNQLTILS